MGAAESQLDKKVLSLEEELALFAYVVDNCGIKDPVPETLKSYNERGCSSVIPDIIRKYGKSSGLDMVVYRGQYDKKKIEYGESKPFFSVTTDPEYAHTFASKLYDEKGEEIKWGIDCCVFRIHLQNVQILDLTEISFDRVLRNPPPIVNLDDDKLPILQKFKNLVNNESEILVLGGGSFYTSPACTEKGCIDPPKFDVPDDEFHQFHETWYSMPKRGKRKAEEDSNPSKRAMGSVASVVRGGDSRVAAHAATNHGAMHHHETRRAFKKPRLMSRKYCKKTPCRRMGFTQKASCRPYKNCYRK